MPPTAAAAPPTRHHPGAAFGWAQWLLLLAALVGLSTSAGAQGAPDLNLMAIDWARGEFASPVMCEIDGEVVRGVRRLTITPEQDRDRRMVALLEFIDMEVEKASRCFDTMGTAMPNVEGKLYLRLPGRSRPDTARLDFKHALQRDKGFTFEVVRGSLRVTDVAQPTPKPRIVDLRRGEVSIGLIAPASDADRQLAPFRSPRKALLLLKSRAGLSLELPIFEAAR